jgi:hypothetical protein
LGEKGVLRRNVFTMEGPGKGSGVAYVTEGDREQEKVMTLKNFNTDGVYQNTE